MMGMFIVVPVLGVVAATWRTVLAVMSMRGRSATLDREQPEPLDREPPPQLGVESVGPAPA